MMSMTNLQVILMVGAGMTAVLSSADLQDSHNFILPENGSFSDFIITESYVRHMEADKFIIGNILFLDNWSLKTTDGNKTETIIGKADRSGYVEGIGTNVRLYSTGFHQISADQVVIADYSNHCLRHLYRVTRQTSPYAGQCTSFGYADGIHALFYYPDNIIPDNFRQASTEEKTLIITDLRNSALREINTQTRVVSTLIQSSEKLRSPVGITQDSATGDLFVTIHHGAVRFIYENKTLIHMTGSHISGDRDGSFSDAFFYNPRGIVLLANNEMLVAEQSNHVLRLLDLTTETTSTICTGNSRGKINGRFNVCELLVPLSLLVVGDILYCGEIRGIRMVEGHTTVTMKRPVNTEEPPGKEYPTDTIIWISVSVGSVLVIGIIVAVVVLAYKRRNGNHTQGDVFLTLPRTQTELRSAHTEFPDDTDNQADIPQVLAPGFDSRQTSRQTNRPTGDAGHYYSTIDDSMGYETPTRSNQSPPSLPERRVNSHQDNIERAEEVNPESVPYILSPGGAPHYSTIDDSMGYKTPTRSNQSPPSLPEKRDNSHQDNIERAEEVNPESVPYILSPGGAPHYPSMS